MTGTGWRSRRRLLGMAAGLLAVGGLRALGVAPPTVAAGPPAPAARPLRAHGRAIAVRQEAGPAVSPFEALLRGIPDTPGYQREIALNDVEFLARTIGAEPPPPDADDATVLAYVRVLFDAGMATGPFISGLDEFARESASRREYLAFGVGDIRHTALAGLPPDRSELIRGRFDPSATEAALAACADCPPPNRETHQGVPFYAWGEDYQQSIRSRFKPPAFDSLGRGGRIAVQHEQVYRTLATDEMHVAIETSLGLRPSLADVESHRALVTGLAGYGVYSIVVSNDPWNQAKRPGTGVGDEPIQQAIDPALLLRPYQTMALGTGRDDAGQYLTVGLFHATPELAAENAEILPQRVDRVPSLETGRPWSELFGDVEAHAEGALLTARLRQRGGSTGLWLSWWSRSDSLLFYNRG